MAVIAAANRLEARVVTLRMVAATLGRVVSLEAHSAQIQGAAQTPKAVIARRAVIAPKEVIALKEAMAEMAKEAMDDAIQNQNRAFLQQFAGSGLEALIGIPIRET